MATPDDPEMTPRFKLRVPEQHIAAFHKLLEVDATAFEAFAAALESLGTASVRVSDLRRTARESLDLPPRDASTVVDALLSMISGRDMHHDTTEDFITGLSTSDDLALAEHHQTLLSNRLLSLLAIPAVTMVGKASDLAAEQERIFHGARLFTDLRPVFGEDAADDPLGAVVTHTLKIDFFHNGMLEDLFVALDGEDLELLGSVVDRARAKNATLGRYLNEIGFTRLTAREKM